MMSYRTFGQAGGGRAKENWSDFPNMRRLQESKEAATEDPSHLCHQGRQFAGGSLEAEAGVLSVLAHGCLPFLEERNGISALLSGLSQMPSVVDFKLSPAGGDPGGTEYFLGFSGERLIEGQTPF